MEIGLGQTAQEKPRPAGDRPDHQSLQTGEKRAAAGDPGLGHSQDKEKKQDRSRGKEQGPTRIGENEEGEKSGDRPQQPGLDRPDQR